MTRKKKIFFLILGLAVAVGALLALIIGNYSQNKTSELSGTINYSPCINQGAGCRENLIKLDSGEYCETNESYHNTVYDEKQVRLRGIVQYEKARHSIKPVCSITVKEIEVL